MAIKFDFLNDNRKNIKRAKLNRPERPDKIDRTEKTEKTDKKEQPITEADVRTIVAREVQAASTMNQMMHYFDDILANDVKSEAMISELRDDVDKSAQNLLATLHKDNLIMYKNMKDMVEENRQTQEVLIKKTRRLSIAVMWLSILCLGGIGAALLKIFEVF